MKLRCHVIEGVGELGDFIMARIAEPEPEVPVRYSVHSFSQECQSTPDETFDNEPRGYRAQQDRDHEGY